MPRRPSERWSTGEATATTGARWSTSLQGLQVSPGASGQTDLPVSSQTFEASKKTPPKLDPALLVPLTGP